MRGRWREDPEIVALGFVIVAFYGCIMSRRPEKALIERAVQAAEVRQAEHAAWAAERPFLAGLRYGLRFDGTPQNCAPRESAIPERVIRSKGLTYVADGRFGQAAQFGSGVFAQAADVRLGEAGTWAAWVRPAPGAGAGQTMRIMDANGSALILSGRQILAALRVPGGCRISGQLPPVGGWFHVAMTWGGGREGTLQLYINGKVTGTAIYFGLPIEPVRDLTFGRGHAGSYELAGQMDDVAIFDRELDAGEIAFLMNKGLSALFDPHAGKAAKAGEEQQGAAR